MLAPIPLFKVFMASTAHGALWPVLEGGRLSNGPQIRSFESRLGTWLGNVDPVALSDASGGLTLALYLAGVGPGDEVITSPLACSATLMPIANLFANPVWCDIDPRTGMMNPQLIPALVSDRTRAILLYHWAGNVADVAAVDAVARQHGIKLVQDASEAFGAAYSRRHLGGEADFTVYSFYATKPLNTGEGGALLARNAADIESARRLRRFGIDYSRLRLANADLNPGLDIPMAGYNLAMNEIAATLGLENLAHADEIVTLAQANGRYYESMLAQVPGVQLLEQNPESRAAYWVFSFRAGRRDDLIRKLGTNGIGSQRLHLRNDGYTCFGGAQQDLPGVAEFDSDNVCIPCGWWVGPLERERIVECIRSGW